MAPGHGRTVQLARTEVRTGDPGAMQRAEHLVEVLAGAPRVGAGA